MDSVYRKHLNELRALEAEASEDSDCPLEEKRHLKPEEIDSNIFYSAMPTFSRFVRTIEYIKSEREKKTDVRFDQGFTNYIVKPEEITQHFNRMGTQHINTYRKEFRDPKEAVEYVKQQPAQNANSSITEAIESSVKDSVALIDIPVESCECIDQLSLPTDSICWEAVTNDLSELNLEKKPSADDASEGAVALVCKPNVVKIINAMAETEREYQEELKKREECDRSQTLKMPFCSEDIAEMQSGNPSTRTQWILNSFFNMNHKICPQQQESRLNFLEDPEARLRQLKQENKNERKSHLELPMAEISRIGKACPITACPGGVGMTSLLAHLLIDHTTGIVVEVRETFAGNIHRIMFNPRNLKFRETVCLGALAYGGVKNGASPGQLNICRDNKFLPPKYQSWTFFLPVMIMLTKSSWTAYCGSAAVDEKLADPKKEDTHIYVIYLLSSQTMKPVYGTITVFDAKLTQSRSRHMACRGLNKSQNPADFLSQETDFLVLQQVEMDRFTRNGKYDVGLEVVLDEKEHKINYKKSFK